MRAHRTVLLAGLASLVGCGIIAGVDRGGIPAGGGGGPLSGVGGGPIVCDPNACPGQDTQCRVRACDAQGLCSFDNLMAGTACSDANNPDAKACNGNGDCVECVDHGDCDPIQQACATGECVPATCGDAIRNQDESDVDCGGICPGCATGQGCNDAGDCVSGVCDTSGGGAGGAGGAGGGGGAGGSGGAGGGSSLPPALGTCA
jgi:hypothetical protein